MAICPSSSRYHLASKDPTFHAEGAAISSLVASVQHLQSEVAALHGNVFQQAVYLSLHVDPAIAHATLGDWVPTFGLSTDGISFALLFALCLWLLFQILWSAGAMGGRGLARRRARRYAASTSQGPRPWRVEPGKCKESAMSARHVFGLTVLLVSIAGCTENVTSISPTCRLA